MTVATVLYGVNGASFAHIVRAHEVGEALSAKGIRTIYFADTESARDFLCHAGHVVDRTLSEALENGDLGVMSEQLAKSGHGCVIDELPPLAHLVSTSMTPMLYLTDSFGAERGHVMDDMYLMTGNFPIILADWSVLHDIPPILAERVVEVGPILRRPGGLAPWVDRQSALFAYGGFNPAKLREVSWLWQLATEYCAKEGLDLTVVGIPSQFERFGLNARRDIRFVSHDEDVRDRLSNARVAFCAGGTCIQEAAAFGCVVYAVASPGFYAPETRRLNLVAREWNTVVALEVGDRDSLASRRAGHLPTEGDRIVSGREDGVAAVVRYCLQLTKEIVH